MFVVRTTTFQIRSCMSALVGVTRGKLWHHFHNFSKSAPKRHSMKKIKPWMYCFFPPHPSWMPVRASRINVVISFKTLSLETNIGITSLVTIANKSSVVQKQPSKNWNICFPLVSFSQMARCSGSLSSSAPWTVTPVVEKHHVWSLCNGSLEPLLS